MCYDDNARPPIPDGERGAAQGEDIVLTSADGTRFMAYFARPEKPGKGQVIIYPDVRGLHQFYKELALRLAEVGISAITIDYFGRTAGISSRDESFEYMPHVQQVTLPNFFQDVQAGLNYLRENADAQGATFPVGFCMGGALSLQSATRSEFGFKGVIAFYAGLKRAFGGGATALEQADKIVYPVLGLFGGADQGIPVSDVRELEAKLQQKGIEEKILVYEGAPHSFFDRRASDYAEASSDAWRQVLGFIASHS